MSINRIIAAIIGTAMLAGIASADGISVSASAKIQIGAISQQQSSGEVVYTAKSGAASYASGTTVLTTDWTAINVGNVGWTGYAWLKNATTNGTVIIGVTNGVGVTEISRMDALNVGLMPLATQAVYYARADPTVTLNGTNAPTTNLTATLIVYIQSR